MSNQISNASPEYTTHPFHYFPHLIISLDSPAPPSNLSPSITSFSPANLTPLIAQNTTTPFSVTTDQAVNSTWYLNGAQPE